jgi:tetratricopeptide (TPR) repeat protein
MKKSRNKTIALLPKILGVIFLFSISSHVLCTPIDNKVKQGISALKQGNYKTALQWLKAAEASASKHTDLRQALGLTYLYLGNFQRSKKYFNLVRNSPRRYEATYYLGVIAMKQGNHKQARDWFLQAANQSDDLEAQEQANKALFRLDFRTDLKGENLTPKPIRHFAYLSLETNFIDGIIDPNDSSIKDAHDTTIALLAAGSRTLTKKQSSIDWKIGGNLYSEKYTNFSIYDMNSYHVYSSIGKTFDNNKLQAKLGFTHSELNDQDYLDQKGLTLQSNLAINNNKSLLLTGRYIDLSSPDDIYAQYNGNTKGLGAELRGGKHHKWRVGIEWRSEQRQGLQTAFTNDAGQNFTGFTGYSRDWVKLKGRISWPLNSKWTQTLEASLRGAKYHDTDSFLANSSDTQLTEQSRKSLRSLLKAELTYHLTGKLDLIFKYKLVDDNGNNDSDDLTSQIGTVGINYLF